MTSQGAIPELRPQDQPSFEESLAELESVVHDLEEGELGLADALARYEQGVKHLKRCYELLEQAERKIELLTGVAEDGTPITQPLDQVTEPLAASTGRKRRAKSTRPDIALPSSSPNNQGDIDDSADTT